MIEVKSLSKKFGHQWALKETNWTVARGRALGLLGPNGAGKSTTLKIMTGLLCSTEGEILVDGKNVMTEPVEAKKQMGYLPETPPLYEDLKVYDFLHFVCGLKSVEKTIHQEQVDKAIEKLTLNEVAFRYIGELSKGFRQRVGIAQALLGEPPLLIFDEPSVGLDPHQVVELRNIIKSLKGEHTIILSTHILSEVQQVCDDVVILNKGKVKAQGDLQDILAQKEGVRRVEIRLNQSNPALEATLKAMPQVTRVKLDDVNLELFVHEKAVDNLNPFLQTIMEHNCGVQSIQQSQHQLEDVFIEVTQ